MTAEKEVWKRTIHTFGIDYVRYNFSQYDKIIPNHRISTSVAVI